MQSPASGLPQSPIWPEHNLKVWPEFFEEIAAGRKNFEARKNDRYFRVGDILNLHEFSPVDGFSDKPPIRRRVSYMLNGGAFGIESGHCVMSLTPTGGSPLASGVPPLGDQPSSLSRNTGQEQLRKAWEAGIRLGHGYGDNFFHLVGEQKERQWNKFLASLTGQEKKEEGESANAGNSDRGEGAERGDERQHTGRESKS